MTVLEIGSGVRTRGAIEAFITAVCIRGERQKSVAYEISYWHNGEYKSVWVPPEEIQVLEGNDLEIGFK